MVCPIARSLERVGEWWSILILRDALHGLTRFDEFQTSLGIAPNTLTFHFDRLRSAGLVTVRRDGRSMIYAARFATMNALLAFLTENCCGGAPETCAPVAVCQPTPTKRRKVPA